MAYKILFLAFSNLVPFACEELKTSNMFSMGEFMVLLFLLVTGVGKCDNFLILQD